jgi:heme/copper-type cytochrome/quinol oxidase subunit 4
MTSDMQRVGQDRASHTRFLVASWAALIGLTTVSWWLGSSHGPSVSFATVAILIIAYLKIYCVGWSFMELRSAARPLVAIFAIWCFATCAILIVLAI